jgi:hypothetical protein
LAKLKIRLPDDKFETTATLLDHEAPRTCAAVTSLLPLEGRLLHAIMSGNETLIELRGEKMIKLEPENWVYNVIPGDIMFWYSHWGEGKYLKDNPELLEVVFIYGRYAKVRNLAHENTAGNLFAILDGKIAEFATVCNRIRFDGAKRIILENL